MNPSDAERLRNRRNPPRQPAARRARPAMLGYVYAPVMPAGETFDGQRQSGPLPPEPATWTGDVGEGSPSWPAGLQALPYDPTIESWMPATAPAALDCYLARLDDEPGSVDTVADPAPKELGGRLVVYDGIRAFPERHFTATINGPRVILGDGETALPLGAQPGDYIVVRRVGPKWQADAPWNPCGGGCFFGQRGLTLTLEYLAWSTDPGQGNYTNSDPTAWKTADLALTYSPLGPQWWAKVSDLAITPLVSNADGLRRYKSWLCLRCGGGTKQLLLYTQAGWNTQGYFKTYYWHAPNVTSCMPLAIDFADADGNLVPPDRGYQVYNPGGGAGSVGTAYVASDLSTFASTYLRSISVTRA